MMKKSARMIRLAICSCRAFLGIPVFASGNLHKNPGFTPLGGPSIYPAWRIQVLSRSASLGFTPQQRRLRRYSGAAGVYRLADGFCGNAAVDTAVAEALRQDEAQGAAACFFIELHFVEDIGGGDVSRDGGRQVVSGKEGGGAGGVCLADAVKDDAKAGGDDAADGHRFAVFPALVVGQGFEGVAEGVAVVE